MSMYPHTLPKSLTKTMGNWSCVVNVEKEMPNTELSVHLLVELSFEFENWFFFHPFFSETPTHTLRPMSLTSLSSNERHFFYYCIPGHCVLLLFHPSYNFSNYERVETENNFVFINQDKMLIMEIQTYAPKHTTLCLNQLSNHIKI